MFFYTRISSSNRFFIRNIANVFVHITPFLGFMVMYTIAFAVTFFAAEPDLDYEDHSTFTNQLFKMYKFSLGKANPSGDTLKNFMYVPATIAVNLVLWNLLIVTILDSFKENKANRIPYDYREITSIIHDYEMMAMWNRRKPLMRYLFICQDTQTTVGINGLVFTTHNKTEPTGAR